MKLYLLCPPEREERFRRLLSWSFSIERLTDAGERGPVGGDVVLVDLATKSMGWLEDLSGLSRSIPGETRLVGVLRPEQMESLDSLTPLDDFISDDSSPQEMRARLTRLFGEVRAPMKPVGELSIDHQRYEVKVGDSPVELTYKEFELLRYLASHPGKVFTREMLLEQVWGYDYFGGSRTVDVHIRRIRSKIEKGGHTYIRTVRGVGYIFEHHPPGAGSPD